jgi:hypothetical protein
MRIRRCAQAISALRSGRAEEKRAAGPARQLACARPSRPAPSSAATSPRQCSSSSAQQSSAAPSQWPLQRHLSHPLPPHLSHSCLQQHLSRIVYAITSSVFTGVARSLLVMTSSDAIGPLLGRLVADDEAEAGPRRQRRREGIVDQLPVPVPPLERHTAHIERAFPHVADGDRPLGPAARLHAAEAERAGDDEPPRRRTPGHRKYRNPSRT